MNWLDVMISPLAWRMSRSSQAAAKTRAPVNRAGVDLLDHRRGFAFELAELLLVDFGVLSWLEVVRPVQIPLETYTVRRCLESSAI